MAQDSTTRRYRVQALVLGVCAFLSIHVAQLVVSPLVPAITDAFDIPYGTIGLALTAMSAGYALLQYPSGVLGDRYGERRLVVASLLLTGLCSLLIAAAPGFPAFLAAAVLLGASAGLYYPVATSLLVKLTEGTGRTIGVHQLGYPLAGLVAPIAATAVAARYGWRAGLVLGAAVALPMAVAVVAGLRRPAVTGTGRSLREAVDPGAMAAVLSRRPIAVGVLLAVLASFVAKATVGFLPAFLVDFRGLSVQRAGLLFSVLFVLQGVAQPLSGWLSDRVGRDAISAGALAVAIVGYLLLIGPDARYLPVAAVVCLGLGAGWSTPVQSRFMDNLTEREQATGFGLVRTTYEILSAAGGFAMGTMVDLADWPVAFGVLAGILAVAVLAIGVDRAWPGRSPAGP